MDNSPSKNDACHKVLVIRLEKTNRPEIWGGVWTRCRSHCCRIVDNRLKKCKLIFFYAETKKYRVEQAVEGGQKNSLTGASPQHCYTKYTYFILIRTSDCNQHFIYIIFFRKHASVHPRSTVEGGLSGPPLSLKSQRFSGLFFLY